MKNGELLQPALELLTQKRNKHAVKKELEIKTEIRRIRPYVMVTILYILYNIEILCRTPKLNPYHDKIKSILSWLITHRLSHFNNNIITIIL